MEKKNSTHKVEGIFLVLFTVMGIGFGLQLSHIQELYPVPISTNILGSILFFLGVMGVVILRWKRDKLQNK
ncbi:MAG: hypothetical protein KAQ92_00905 [Candidatus Aenigmarchaeota archaeon]|nr:hypothetical protein [Candidatus Aenigmarchaeota archaeon]